MKYVALVRKEPNSDFGVDFPDFPGCVSAGSTLDEAREMAEEALAFHIEGLLEDGASLPEPAPIETILMAEENQDVATVFLIEARRPLLA